MSGRDEGGEGEGREGDWAGTGLVGHSKHLILTLSEVGAKGGFGRRKDMTSLRSSQDPSDCIGIIVCMGVRGSSILQAS